MAGRCDDPPITGPNETWTVETWKPSLGISVVWTVISVVLTIGSFAVFLAADSFLSGGIPSTSGDLVQIDQSDGDEVSVTLSGAGILLLIAVGGGILLVHEAVHGAAFWFFGGRPIFGAALYNRILPVLYCSAPGYMFNRGQFAVIVLAPAVVITVVGLLLMPLTGLGWWLAVPLAINFGGAVGDFWFVGLLALRPAGTLIEDLKDGLRFYYPVPGGA